jgi:hypothetical protein
MWPVRLLFLAVLLAAMTACIGSGSTAKPVETAETVAPTVAFNVVAWTIEFNPLEDAQGVSMFANVFPLTVGEVQDLGGSLVWTETEISLCADAKTVGSMMGGGISVREVGDGFLQIGDGFGSNETGDECNIGMLDAFNNFGLPQEGCLFVTAGKVRNEFCAPLRVDRSGSW